MEKTKIYYYIKDHLGSIRVTIDSYGNIVSAQDYYAYSELLRAYTAKKYPMNNMNNSIS